MGSDASVLVVGGPAGLTQLAQERLEELEALWSRFRPTSEISLLNEAGGQPMAVSAETLDLIGYALEAWRVTEGSYDPTVLGDVLRAGYTTTFEALPAVAAASGLDLRIGAGGIRIDREAGTAQLPRGVGFDPGGIGKGLAADMVADQLRAAGADGVCVNVGGDLAVSGRGPDIEEAGWVVGVENPFTPEGPEAAALSLHEGGVATSSRLRRSWQAADGTRAHHLINPRTGAPACSGLATVTVVAARAWQAEMLAKAVFLAGPARGAMLLDDLGAAGLLITDEGRILATAGLAAFQGGTMEAGDREELEEVTTP